MSDTNLTMARKLIVLADKIQELEAASKPAYLGLFLTPSAKSELLNKVPAVHETVHADHVTVMHIAEDKTAFMEKVMEHQGSIRMKIKVDIKVTGVVADEKAQAVVVEIPSVLQKINPNKVLHITISSAPEVGPRYSNELIQMGKLESPKPPFPFHISAELDTFPRGMLIEQQEATV